MAKETHRRIYKTSIVIFMDDGSLRIGPNPDYVYDPRDFCEEHDEGVECDCDFTEEEEVDPFPQQYVQLGATNFEPDYITKVAREAYINQNKPWYLK